MMYAQLTQPSESQKLAVARRETKPNLRFDFANFLICRD